MIDIEFKIEGLGALTRKLRDLDKRQVPYATKEAINATLERILKAEQGAMKQHLDNPNKWTLNSLRIDYATKDKLNGKVWFKDAGTKGTAAYKYLSVQDEGGPRREKGFEKWLMHKGFLSPGWSAMPAQGSRLTQYGNISGGMHTKILSALRALPPISKSGRAFTGNRAAGVSTDFFWVGPGEGLAPGIYKRKGRSRRGAEAIFVFVQKRPQYKARLPWYPVAQKTFDRHFEREFDKAFERAMSTAR